MVEEAREVHWIVTSEIPEAIIGRIERWMGRRPYSKLHLLEIDRPRKDDCLRRDGWRFPASRLGGHQSALFLSSRGSNPLKADWQTHVLASSGYLELGMFDDAALVLEEIAPEDKNRNEVCGARVNLYMVAKKWDMAAAVASHLVKVEPENDSWWITLAYSVRRTEGVGKAEAILLRGQAIHPKNALIAFSLACYASVAGRMEEAKARLRHAIDLDNGIRKLALNDEDLKPLWDWIGGLSAGRGGWPKPRSLQLLAMHSKRC